MHRENQISCRVCNNPKASNRYNSFACNACRVFFSRHYNRNQAFHCNSGSGNCEITYEKQQIKCISCRLKKCYKANMMINEGGKDVVAQLHVSQDSYPQIRTLTVRNRFSIDIQLQQIYGEIINGGFKVVGHLKKTHNSSAWIDCLMHFDSKLLSAGGKSPSSSDANTSMQLNDCLMFPGACIDRSTAVIDRLADDIPTAPYKLKETICRIFVAAIENMSFIEEYHHLLPVDRIRLLQQNAFMFSNYILLYTKFIKRMDTEASIRYIMRFKMAEGVAHLWNKILAIWSTPSHLKTMDLMKELQPTEKEWLFLRMRSMFRPCPSMSSEGYALVLKVRLKFTCYLAEYLRETYPSLDHEQIRQRLSKLLEIESYIQDTEQIMYSVFTTMTLQHSSGWSTPLLHDIFIRKF